MCKHFMKAIAVAVALGGLLFGLDYFESISNQNIDASPESEFIEMVLVLVVQVVAVTSTVKILKSNVGVRCKPRCCDSIWHFLLMGVRLAIFLYSVCWLLPLAARVVFLAWSYLISE